MGLLDGKTALVTGGASGIGEKIVRNFLEEGARVSVIDKDADGLKILENCFPDRNKLRTIACDLSSQADLQMLREDLGLFECVDVLVNNAAIEKSFYFTTTDWAVLDSVMKVNFYRAAYITRLALKGMLRNIPPGGSIIFITSVRTNLAMRGGAAYESSKHALIGLMRSIAYEYGPQVRANAIAPGAIYPSGMNRNLTEQDKQILIAETPLGRLGAPEEVARACVFLASDMSSFITGQVLGVDGGITLGKSRFYGLTPKDR